MVPFLQKIPFHFLKMKERHGFIETPPFDSPFPFISMFFMRPPNSNLLMSPSINIRHVACDSFAIKDSGNNNNLRDILYQKDEGAQSTFRSRQIVLFPYKLSKSTDKGVPIQSVSCYKVRQSKKIKENTLVVLENATASNITRRDFEQVMALFGRQIDERNDVYNFVELFSVGSGMTDPIELLNLVDELGFPKALIDLKLRVEVNMRNLGSFISMCSPIYFGAPEGQTRLEAVSRPCFGYPLYGIAPLRDDKSDLISEFVQESFFKESQSLPTHSTAFRNVQGSVLYTSNATFDKQQVEDLKEVSRIIQDQGILEINTTFQTFYKIVVEEVQNTFSPTNKPLTEIEWANYDLQATVVKVSKGRKKEGPVRTRMTNISRVLNKVLINKVFSICPFNLNKPKNPDSTADILTNESFEAALLKKPNWFTQKHFETIFKQEILFNKDLCPNDIYFLPSQINKYLCASPKLDPIIKSYKWGKSPSPSLLFELMFSVFGYQPLLDTFNEYLQAFEGTSRFYDPLWLSLYVFLPINTIATFYKGYYTSEVMSYEVTGNLQGKSAPGKWKQFAMFRNILLQEYFQTIIKFANKNKFNENETFANFSLKQMADYNNWGGSSEEKAIWIAKEYLEMILLTLPEKLFESIKNKTFKPFVNCDFQWLTGIVVCRPNAEAGRSNEDTKNFEEYNGLPSINNLLPVNLIPSRIMVDEKLASEYITETLIQSTKSKAKRKATSPNKKKRSKQKRANNKDDDDDDDETDDETDKDDEEKETTPTKLISVAATNKNLVENPVAQQIMFGSQTVRLQIRLALKMFNVLNSEIQAKKKGISPSK